MKAKQKKIQLNKNPKKMWLQSQKYKFKKTIKLTTLKLQDKKTYTSLKL